MCLNKLLFLSIIPFLFAACNEEQKFMTPKPGEIVLDVKTDEYSLNKKVLGKTPVDFSNDVNLLVIPLDEELKRIRSIEQEEALRAGQPVDEFLSIRIRFDENLSYDVFYKSIATAGFSAYTKVQFVLGTDFKNVYGWNLPERSQFGSISCKSIIEHQRLMQKIAGKQKEIYRPLKNFSDNENIKERIDLMRIECAKKNIGLLLSFYSNDDGFTYDLSLNETGLVDGRKFHTFENMDGLWKFIEDIQSKFDLRDKEDKDEIVIALKNDVLLKDLEPVIRRLKNYGYKVQYAIISK